MNIAIVEDDPLQRRALRNWLEDAGHCCNSFDSGSDFTQTMQRGDYQFLLFDWELPGMSGIELLTWLRAQINDHTPVIFITARDREEDIVLALRQGADDYLVKPARKQELLARIDALARRMPPATHSGNQYFGNLLITPQEGSIHLNGEQVALTQKEYLLARYLLANIGKPISRGELMTAVWGHSNNVHTRSIDTHISRLRNKLRLTPDNNWQLSAVYQYGYRLDHGLHEKQAVNLPPIPV
jgi:two-component system response regulator RegX3